MYIVKDSIKKYFWNFSNTFPLDHIINFFLDHPVHDYKDKKKSSKLMKKIFT